MHILPKAFIVYIIMQFGKYLYMYFSELYDKALTITFFVTIMKFEYMDHFNQIQRLFLLLKVGGT